MFQQGPYMEATADHVATGPAKSSQQDPHKFFKQAVAFVEDLLASESYPLYFDGKFYVYRKCRYVEERELAQRLRTFFRTKNWSQSNNVIGNVLPIVQNIAYKSVLEYKAMPFYFGNDPFPQPARLVAYQNGLLDLDAYFAGNVELIPHTPKFVNSICLPFDFDPSAQCPSWHEFQQQIFEGDEERMKLQQEWFGYCLTGDTSQHKLLIQHGCPRAGKSTCMAVQEALVGKENSTGFSLFRLAERFACRSLVGKLVAFIGEANLANCREKHRILETTNRIVGEDAADIEEKNNPLLESVVLPTRFVISCNEMPNFFDPAGAFSSRLLILEFNKSFEGKEDRGLKAKLLSEISGINNWALAGYARLRQNGRFTEPQRMKHLVNRCRRDNSDVLAFAQDCLVVERRYDPGNPVGVELVDRVLPPLPQHELEDAYARWTEGEYDRPAFKRHFFKNLRAIFPKLPDYDKKRKEYSGFILKSS